MRTASLALANFLMLCLGAAHCPAQGRYTIATEDAMGPGSPRVVVLRDAETGSEAAVAPSEGGELSSYRVRLQGKTTELLYHARDYTPGPRI